jgi:hypothetical protein
MLSVIILSVILLIVVAPKSGQGATKNCHSVSPFFSFLFQLDDVIDSCHQLPG